MTKLSIERLANLKLLLTVDGIGPAKIRQLLSKFKSTDNILSADYALLTSVEGINKNLASRIQKINHQKQFVFQSLQKELERLQKMQSRIVTIWDDEYPPLLKKIYDPPLILYYAGYFKENDNTSIAVVGTRQPTNYGKQQTEKITEELSKLNITIVSGMARGIDSISHRTALRSGGRTIAVIGSGLNVVYPPENKKLFDEIAEKGLIISEYELDTKPDAVNFPKRNRIISGLSLGTIIIETGITGGAMQTARFALDQNREVFAVPGNINVKQSEGSNLLIQKGEAKLIRNAEDILIELELKLKPIIGKNIPKPKIDLNLFEEKIIDVLKADALQIDKIASETNLTTSDCLVHLLSLEFKGLVKQLPGKVFELI